MRLFSKKDSMKAVRCNRKTVKGMTLVECIIALFVFTVCALILVKVGEAVYHIRTDALHLENKTDVEGPVSTVHDVNAVINAGDLVDDDGNVIRPGTSNVTITVGKAGVDANNNTIIQGAAFNTYTATKYDTVMIGRSARATNTAGDVDLQFYVIP